LCAIACPMPRPAPVINATLLSKRAPMCRYSCNNMERMRVL
jgi:hypothetical protein